MKKHLLHLLLTSLLIACGGATSNNPEDENLNTNPDSDSSPEAENDQENETRIANWQELLGTWDASAATSDDSDTIFVTMQQDGTADYLNFNNPESCYDKTKVTLIDQGDGSFKHETSGIILIFTLSADNSTASISNNLDGSSYDIHKSHTSEEQLIPICVTNEDEIPSEESFTNASLDDLLMGNGIWNASTIDQDNQLDIKYVAFRQGSGSFSADEVIFYDYKNDGIEGANSDCYEKTAASLIDKGEGNFTIASFYNLHVSINESASILKGVYTANNETITLAKTDVENLTLSSFNTCP